MLIYNQCKSKPGLEELKVPDGVLLAESIVVLDPLDQAADARVGFLKIYLDHVSILSTIDLDLGKEEHIIIYLKGSSPNVIAGVDKLLTHNTRLPSLCSSKYY